MKEENKKDVIEFYENIVWLPGMIKSEALTNEDIKFFYNTYWFARWNLANKYNKCVVQIKASIKQVINKI